jgi:hypothetical protein
VTTAIAIYFSENYLKSFEEDEIRCCDVGEIIVEPLNNIARHCNPDPTHQNHVFYFHSSIDKGKGIINFEFTDFNLPIPEVTKKAILKSEDIEEIDESTKSIEELEESGLGEGLKTVNKLAKVKGKKTLNLGNWYDKNNGKILGILGNKITCSMEL